MNFTDKIKIRTEIAEEFKKRLIKKGIYNKEHLTDNDINTGLGLIFDMSFELQEQKIKALEFKDYLIKRQGKFLYYWDRFLNALAGYYSELYIINYKLKVVTDLELSFYEWERKSNL